MKTPVVRLKIRVRLSDGSRPFLDPVLSNNGKLKPLYALVHGKPEHHPEGVYFLRYLNDGKRIWQSVGTDPNFALDEKRRREKGLDAQAAGVTLAEQPERSTPIKAAIAEYLEEVRDAKATKTFLAYCLTLRLFAEADVNNRFMRDSLLPFVALGSPKTKPGCVSDLASVRPSESRSFIGERFGDFAEIEETLPRITGSQAFFIFCRPSAGKATSIEYWTAIDS